MLNLTHFSFVCAQLGLLNVKLYSEIRLPAIRWPACQSCDHVWILPESLRNRNRLLHYSRFEVE